MTWFLEHYDTQTRIYVSAIFFFSTLFISFFVGNAAALGYLVFTLFIPRRPPTWFEPIFDFVSPYFGEQPPPLVRRFLSFLEIRY